MASVILSYCSVMVLFVVYHYGVTVGNSGWQVNVFIDCVDIAIAKGSLGFVFYIIISPGLEKC